MAQNLKAIQYGHHEIHKYDVVSLPGDHGEANFAVFCGIDIKTIKGFDTCLKSGAHGVFVIDNEDFAEWRCQLGPIGLVQ